MRLSYLLIRDFFNVSLATWFVLLVFEVFNPGMVQRYLNLEYYFYFLIILFIIYRSVRKY